MDFRWFTEKIVAAALNVFERLAWQVASLRKSDALLTVCPDTRLVLVSRFTTGPHRWMAVDWLRSERRVAFGLAGVVFLAFVVDAALAGLVRNPHVFGDELSYASAAWSLAHGQGALVRGHDYGFGLLYPAVLSLLVRVSPDFAHAYALFKLANAAFFALAAVPLFFLARRLLRPWPALLAATLSVALPSAVYTGSVLTESLGYLLASSCLLAIMLTLERPTFGRQLGAVATIGLAYLVRPQFVILAAAYLLAIPLNHVVSKPAGRPLSSAAHRWWPTLAICGLAVMTLVLVAVMSRSTVSGELGAYQPLWRSYNLFTTLRWSAYHLADLALYLAFLPIIVLPVVLGRLGRRAKTGSSRSAAAYLSLFIAANVSGILLVGAFASSPYGLNEIHDRYTFYLVPLWLIGFVYWLQEGAPRPRREITLGVGLAIALAAVYPYGRIGSNSFEDVASGIWGFLLDLHTPFHLLLGGKRPAGILLVATIALAALTPRRYRWLLATPLLAIFLGNGVAAWSGTIERGQRQVVSSGPNGSRNWVDQALPPGKQATLLQIGSPNCIAQRKSFAVTEFFNRSIRTVITLGHGLDNLPAIQAHLDQQAVLETRLDHPIISSTLVAPTDVKVNGRQIASNAKAGLILWHTKGPITIEPDTNDQLPRDACAT